MTRISLLGFALTGVYFIILLGLLALNDVSFRTLTANEIGDFLAGAFSPPALLWLVLGYFQQRAELAQNTRALEIQAEELHNSVRQQKRLVRLTKDQVDLEMERAAEERRRVAREELPALAVSLSEREVRGCDVDVEVLLRNTAECARELRLHSPSDRVEVLDEHLEALDTGERVKMGVRLHLNGLVSRPQLPLVVDYVSQNGTPGRKTFRLDVEIGPEGRPQCHAAHDPAPGVRNELNDGPHDEHSGEAEALHVPQPT